MICSHAATFMLLILLKVLVKVSHQPVDDSLGLVPKDYFYATYLAGIRSISESSSLVDESLGLML